MVTLHEVITFLVSMQISISSLQTHNVNRCGRSRHLARKLSLRRKRSSPNVFERSEERRVGKECRARGSPEHKKKKRRDTARTKIETANSNLPQQQKSSGGLSQEHTAY